jgi:hypothetical protein
MVNIIDLISQKIELFRLEQRYTKRRNRRSTFVSDATYVDGEYIYPSPSPTLSKRHSVQQFHSSSQESMSTEESRSPRGARYESEGSDSVGDLGKAKQKRGWNSARMLKRRSMVTVQEVRWEERP